MPLTGALRTWNDERGYGFIAPRDGGRELFVHISAFPRDGSRPTVGESLTYEVGTGKGGKPQAVRVYRQALGRPTEYPRSDRHRNTRKSSVAAIAGFLAVAAAAAYGYGALQQRSARPTSQEVSAAFHCDGRTHCSQMTSCSEAKFFLKNCPGTSMDGDHDGVPCEQQWCTE